jgi:hypothetical protein
LALSVYLRANVPHKVEEIYEYFLFMDAIWVPMLNYLLI